MSKSYQKEYRDNMSDEQKQKLKDYQKKYRDNMSDEQKQKLKDYQKRAIRAIRLMNKNKNIEKLISDIEII